MDRYVVVSLYTDGEGPRRDEFNALREKLTRSVSNPMYAVIDPAFPDRPLHLADYNDAMDTSFAARLDKARRRFERALVRRGGTPAKED